MFVVHVYTCIGISCNKAKGTLLYLHLSVSTCAFPPVLERHRVYVHVPSHQSWKGRWYTCIFPSALVNYVLSSCQSEKCTYPMCLIPSSMNCIKWGVKGTNACKYFFHLLLTECLTYWQSLHDYEDSWENKKRQSRKTRVNQIILSSSSSLSKSSSESSKASSSMYWNQKQEKLSLLFLTLLIWIFKWLIPHSYQYIHRIKKVKVCWSVQLVVLMESGKNTSPSESKCWKKHDMVMYLYLSLSFNFASHLGLSCHHRCHLLSTADSSFSSQALHRKRWPVSA